MHEARAFFYCCAGLFLLPLSYHLGARHAEAQLPGSIVAASLIGKCGFAVVGRTVYVNGVPFDGGQVPGGDPVIAVGPGDHGGPLVMLANGEVYWGTAPVGGAWQLSCNGVGGPTPVEQETLGGLKVKCR